MSEKFLKRSNFEMKQWKFLLWFLRGKGGHLHWGWRGDDDSDFIVLFAMQINNIMSWSNVCYGNGENWNFLFAENIELRKKNGKFWIGLEGKIFGILFCEEEDFQIANFNMQVEEQINFELQGNFLTFRWRISRVRLVNNREKFFKILRKNIRLRLK